MPRYHTILGSLAVLTLASRAGAAPLNLILECRPDITSGFIDVEYDASSDILSANGFALSIVDNCANPSVDFDVLGSFDIAATVDGVGVASAGTLSITGEVLGFGPNLLSGTLSAFGFLDAPGGDIFEFLFTITGGDLAIPAYFGNPGNTVGVILNAAGSGFDGTFGSNFNNNGGLPGYGYGVSDTAPPVPEPVTCALMLAGAVMSGRNRALRLRGR